MLHLPQYGNIHPSNKDQIIEVNGLTFKFCAKCTCRKSGTVGSYNRNHTTSQHITGASLTTNGTHQGDSPVTDTNSSSNYSPVSVETAQAENIDSNSDPNPDEIIFEGAFLSLVVDDGTWMASEHTDVDTFSPGIMYIVTTDIVYHITSIPIDDKDFQYDNDEINFVEIPVDPTITIPEITDPFDSNTIKDSASAYADSLSICPSSSDFKNYFDCIDELSYHSPDFNCEGERQTYSVGTTTSEVREHDLATISIESFSEPIDQQYYFSAVSSIESTDSKVESFYQCMKLIPKPLTLPPYPSRLSIFRA